MDWSGLYPAYFSKKEIKEGEQNQKRMKLDEKRVEFADIGCGYGGLLGKWGCLED